MEDWIANGTLLAPDADARVRQMRATVIDLDPQISNRLGIDTSVYS